MPTYCAFLGHQPHISLAELSVLLPDMTIQKLWTPSIVTFETKANLDTEWLRQLGGTVLIAKELSSKKRDGSLGATIPALLYEQLKGVERKAVFSFRCLSVPRNEIRSLYKLSKQYLKGKGMPSRYIGNERNPAQPGTLLLRGIPGQNSCELVILKDDKQPKSLKVPPAQMWIGSTCAVQDIEAYTGRDMEKPFRDTRTGLLPPKLAQIMLNLSLFTLPATQTDAIRNTGKWEGSCVWDPFCGSGVIALEALHRRMHVIASDKTEKAVNGTLQNIKWFRDKEKTPKSIQHHVWKQNALKKCELPMAPSVIVTETSLGPAMKQSPTKKDVAAFLREGDALESAFFEAMASLLPTVPIICTFPVYVTRDGEKHFLPRALDKAQKLGYRITCVNNPHVKLTDRHTLLYLRPDQFVGREIICFMPPEKSA